MRILVCGGRDFDRRHLLYNVLDDIIHHSVDDITIISGMAKGADTLAVWYARDHEYTLMMFPADWETYGKSAGPIRNQQMIEEGKPDLVIAFPTKNSRGTYDMIRRAEKHNIKTIIVKEEG